MAGESRREEETIDRVGETLMGALSESAVIEQFAEAICHRITRKVIAHLQSMKDLMSGDDSGLTNTWDEICVQVQYEKSAFWNVYDETVRAIVGSHVENLAPHEKAAVWLQTLEAQDWQDEPPEDRSANPVCDIAILNYLLESYVYSEAMEWSNRGIRAYLERQYGD